MKKKWIKKILLVVTAMGLILSSPFTSHAASSYTNAKEFYETANVDKPYRVETYDASIYYASRGKLASNQNNLKYRTKALLKTAVAEFLPILEKALAATPAESGIVKVEDLWFGRDYLTDMRNTFLRILGGEPVSWTALCQAITLEMIANSNHWAKIRYHARQFL